MPKEKNRSHKGAIFQTVEKATLPQVISNSFNKEIKIKKVLQKKEAQGNHREYLVLTCFFRSCSLSYLCMPTSSRTKNIAIFFEVCPSCRSLSTR
jgi:hypothetical protein